MDYFYAPYIKHENKEQSFMTFEDTKANDKMNWNPITSFVFTKNTMPFEKAMMKLSMHKIKGKRGSRLPAKNDSNLTYDLNDMIKKYSNNNQMRHRASAIQKLDLLNININREKIRKSQLMSNENVYKISKLAESVIKKDPQSRRFSRVKFLHRESTLKPSLIPQAIDKLTINKNQKLMRPKLSACNLQFQVNEESKRLNTVIKVETLNPNLNKSWQGRKLSKTKNSTNSIKSSDNSKMSTFHKLSKENKESSKKSSQDSSTDSQKIMDARK